MATHIVYRTTAVGIPPVSTTVKGSPLTLVEGDANMKSIVDSVDLKSPLLSPTFTGNPTAPTPTAGNSSTNVATTEFVSTAISNFSTTYVDTEIAAAVAPLSSTAYVDSSIASAATSERTASSTLTNKTLVNPSGGVVALTDAATTAWDMDLGQVATWSITAVGRTLSAPTNYKTGVVYTMFLQLANPTTMNPTWPSSFKFQYDIPPDLSTSTITVLSLIWSPLHTKFCVFPAPGL